MKKVFTIGGALFVIVLIAVVLFFFQKQNSPSSQTNTTTTQQVFDFTLTAPDGWVPSYYTFDGGKIYTLKPLGQVDSVSTPTFILEQHRASDLEKLQTIVQNAKDAGYASSHVSINSQDVDKEEGSMVYIVKDSQGRVIARVTPSTTTQEAIMLYPYKDSIYVMRYKYGGNTNPQWEQAFSTILQSIHTN